MSKISPNPTLPESRAAAEKAILELRQQIEKHNFQYHVLDDPTISDADYDGWRASPQTSSRRWAWRSCPV
jgi:NAD-dependent DNA ligase